MAWISAASFAKPPNYGQRRKARDNRRFNALTPLVGRERRSEKQRTTDVNTLHRESRFGNSASARAMPVGRHERLQNLLDQADNAWFSRNPDEQSRVRFHFDGERVEPDRFVVVTRRADGSLQRHFQGTGGAA